MPTSGCRSTRVGREEKERSSTGENIVIFHQKKKGKKPYQGGKKVDHGKNAYRQEGRSEGPILGRKREGQEGDSERGIRKCEAF